MGLTERCETSLVTPCRLQQLAHLIPCPQVVVPSTNGAFGIMKDHVPTIAQLDAGLLTVHSSGEEDKYFVSGLLLTPRLPLSSSFSRPPSPFFPSPSRNSC